MSSTPRFTSSPTSPPALVRQAATVSGKRLDDDERGGRPKSLKRRRVSSKIKTHLGVMPSLESLKDKYGGPDESDGRGVLRPGSVRGFRVDGGWVVGMVIRFAFGKYYVRGLVNGSHKLYMHRWYEIPRSVRLYRVSKRCETKDLIRKRYSRGTDPSYGSVPIAFSYDSGSESVVWQYGTSCMVSDVASWFLGE